MDLPQLDAIEARVLGSLVEKAYTTPEYYPLSLNALVNACNQKNNRDPVVSYGESEVNRALDELRNKKLAYVVSGGTSRVLKFGQKLAEALELDRGEASLIAELLLRGPQTPGELRARAERMHAFADLPQVVAVLAKLMERAPPLVALLPRQPGTKESRYAQLLHPVAETSSETAAEKPGSAGAVAATPTKDDRIAALEGEIGPLKEQIATLRREFEDFRRKFE